MKESRSVEPLSPPPSITSSHDPVPQPVPEYEEILELREARRRADSVAGEQTLRVEYDTQNPAYAGTNTA